MRFTKRLLCLLLAVMLVFSVPLVAMAEALPESTEMAETTVPEDTEATEEAAEPSTEAPAEDSTEKVESPAEDIPDESEDERLLGASAYASTQNSIMLFDFADNGDYTTRLNYQVTCAYKPNGRGTTRTAYVKNMGWHFARYGGVAHADEPLYCIEPWRNYAASTSGNSVDRDVTLNGSGSTTGSNVWYALPSARREAIGLILLYSDQQWDHSISVTSVKKDSNPNVPLRVATQILIYEIVCGLRDPSSFNRNSSNECGTSGDVFYNAAAASVSGFTSCYNSLVSAIQAAKKIPSFCGSSSSNAPTIQLSGDTGSAYDSNGVLSVFSFLQWKRCQVQQKRQHPEYHKNRGYFRIHGVHRNPVSALGIQFQLQYLVYVGFQLSDDHLFVQRRKQRVKRLFQDQGTLPGEYQPDKNHRGWGKPVRLEVWHLF